MTKESESKYFYQIFIEKYIYTYEIDSKNIMIRKWQEQVIRSISIKITQSLKKTCSKPLLMSLIFSGVEPMEKEDFYPDLKMINQAHLNSLSKSEEKLPLKTGLKPPLFLMDISLPLFFLVIKSSITFLQIENLLK